MFQTVQGHRYCNLGAFFSLTFENADITCEDNEVVADLANPVSPGTLCVLDEGPCGARLTDVPKISRTYPLVLVRRSADTDIPSQGAVT